jgi:hypothetical protein
LNKKQIEETKEENLKEAKTESENIKANNEVTEKPQAKNEISKEQESNVNELIEDVLTKEERFFDASMKIIREREDSIFQEREKYFLGKDLPDDERLAIQRQLWKDMVEDRKQRETEIKK